MDSKTNFFRRLNDILVYRKGDQRSPHKPLYLLYCIASIQAGRERLQSFDEVSKALMPALRIFAPRTASVHPEYPFWRLQHDDLAEVLCNGPLVFRKSNSDPTVSSLRNQNSRGGLLEADHEMLRRDLELQSLTVHKILDGHFPSSVHEELIRFFGLKLDDRHAHDRTSDEDFRIGVLAAYESRCALTEFNLDMGGRTIGVEAAHIIWPQAGGNDEVSNGIAMSILHRRLFHLGLFSINNDFKVTVATQVSSKGRSNLTLSELNGMRIRLPSDQSLWPSPKALEWHQRWVFRG